MDYLENVLLENMKKEYINKLLILAWATPRVLASLDLLLLNKVDRENVYYKDDRIYTVAGSDIKNSVTSLKMEMRTCPGNET